MRSIPLATTQVSVVGYGGMHLSLTERPPEGEAVKVIQASLEAGVTLIDTADAYCLDASDIGHNERLIAKALREWKGPREGVLVATKGGIIRIGGRWDRDGSPDHLRSACDASLKALGVERIALYQLHAPDPAVPFDESIGAMAELQRAGKVRWIGLSNVSVEEIRRAQPIAQISSVQNRLNPFFRESLTEGVVQYCGANGIAFLAYSPTGGGRLTKKLPDHPVLAEIGHRLGVTAHAVCLAWVLAQGRTVTVIPSARKLAHTLDSASAASLTLSPEDLERVTQATFDRT
jgi:aryl-alcohol dehydrogenase-like predicted oxidoreductase